MSCVSNVVKWAIVVIVADAAWNSRPYTAALFWRAMSATSAGNVKTTWK
jgi:hypothetical protein